MTYRASLVSTMIVNWYDIIVYVNTSTWYLDTPQVGTSGALGCSALGKMQVIRRTLVACEAQQGKQRL